MVTYPTRYLGGTLFCQANIIYFSISPTSTLCIMTFCKHLITILLSKHCDLKIGKPIKTTPSSPLSTLLSQKSVHYQVLLFCYLSSTVPFLVTGSPFLNPPLTHELLKYRNPVPLWAQFCSKTHGLAMSNLLQDAVLRWGSIHTACNQQRDLLLQSAGQEKPPSKTPSRRNKRIVYIR